MAYTVTQSGSNIKITGNSYTQYESASALEVVIGANSTVIIYDKIKKTTLVNAVYSDYTTPSQASAELLAANLSLIISNANKLSGVPYRNIDVDESADQVRSSAGYIYWIHAINLSAATLYLQVYNKASASVTVGTTTPDFTFPVPTQGDTNGAGFNLSFPNGVYLDTALTIAGTTGISDNGAPGTNELIVNMGI